jgi:hypothetical protein
VQPSAVGYPTVTAQGAQAFADVLATASQHGLSVQLTLFDWWNAYDDVVGAQQWATSLLSGAGSDATIALVELQNEIPTSSPAAMTWARAMLPFLSVLLPQVPRTLSTSGAAGKAGVTALAAQIPDSMLDVVDLHVYGEPARAASMIRLGKSLARGRPVIVGEAGRDSVGGAAGEEAQARFYRVLGRTAAALGLPPVAPWILSDFTASAMPRAAAGPQYSYGLRRTNGSWKPAAAVVRQLFTGAPPIDIDPSFERERSGGLVLGSWSAFATSGGTATVARDVVRTGHAAVCFSRTRGTATAVPSVVQEFPILRTGAQVAASAYVRRFNATGRERIGLAWLDADGHYLGQTESALSSLPGWTMVRVVANAPTRAASFQVHLKASSESGRACYDDAVVRW